MSEAPDDTSAAVDHTADPDLPPVEDFNPDEQESEPETHDDEATEAPGLNTDLESDDQGVIPYLGEVEPDEDLHVAYTEPETDPEPEDGE